MESGVAAFQALMDIEALLKEVSEKKKAHYEILFGHDYLDENNLTDVSIEQILTSNRISDDIDKNINLAEGDLVNKYNQSIYRLNVINSLDAKSRFHRKVSKDTGGDCWEFWESDEDPINCRGQFENMTNGKPECRDPDDWGWGWISQWYRNCSSLSVVINESDNEPKTVSHLNKFKNENWLYNDVYSQRYHIGLESSLNDRNGGLVNPVAPLSIFSGQQVGLSYDSWAISVMVMKTPHLLGTGIQPQEVL